MIETSKLRVKNVVLDYNDQLITISAIGDTIRCQENEQMYMPLGIKGVPLSLAILILCFDFDYAYDELKDVACAFKKNDIFVELKSQGAFVYIGQTFLKHVFFVHELQNIISLISDEETANLIPNLSISLPEAD